MPLSFPPNPPVGTQYGMWTWDGVKWVCTAGIGENGMAVSQIIFGSSGVYTPSPGLISAMIELQGGGGAGGNVLLGASVQGGGGGGGAGCYCRGVFPAALIGASQSFVVGAGGQPVAAGGVAGSGGTSSFGALMIAPGGGGGGAWDQTPSNTGNPGLGGNPNVGITYLGVPGGSGETTVLGTASLVWGAHGGTSFLSGGTGIRSALSPGQSQAGLIATGWGDGGGGGANAGAAGTTWVLGAAGHDGLVIVTEYT